MGTSMVAVAERPRDLLDFFEKAKGQLDMALPDHLAVDRMIRLVASAWSRSAKLQQCTLHSIFSSAMAAAQMGLEVGVGGQGWLIPYSVKEGKERRHFAQFVPGWQGLVDLATRSGRSTVWTGAVYVGDEFDWQLGDDPFIRHKNKDETHGLDNLLYVYAVGQIKGQDAKVREVWSKEKVIRHLNEYNRVGGEHYALKDACRNFEMYARKVALLQVLKYMPKSAELQRAMEVSHVTDTGRAYTLDGDFVAVMDADYPDDLDDLREAGRAGEVDDFGVRAKSDTRQPATQAAASAPAPTPAPDDTPADHPAFASMPDDGAPGVDPRQMTIPDVGGTRLKPRELTYLRAKMEMANVPDDALRHQFGVTPEQVSAEQYPAVLAWIRGAAC